jgi:chromosome segregation ATPase
MAKSFLTKFNTLIQANVRNPLGGRRPREAGDNLEAEIARLREVFHAAEQDQAAVDGRIAALDEDILKWDAQADDALRAGNEAEARHIIEQIERARRKRTMMQSERDAHQRAMNQLFTQISQLEAFAETPATETPHPSETPQQSLSDAIRQAREAAQASSHRIQVETHDETDASAAVDQELAARRARLAKPD